MGRMKVLDGLRAIAVLLVMLSHASLGHIIPGGFGVTIFFFLSGYLITTLLRIEFERDGTVSFRGFYLRRTVRIIPPMLICYGVAVLLMQSGAVGRELVPAGIPWDLLFLTNYAEINSRIPIPLWSLNIEEHFYLLFPAVFLLILRLPPNTRVGAILALIGAALALRFFEIARGNAYYIFYWSHTRFDAILFGVLLTVDQARGNKTGSTWPYFTAGLGAILLSFVIRDEVFRETVRYTLQGVGLFFVFKFLLEGGRNIVSAALETYPLKRIADWSYVLYLIHMPLLLAAEHGLTGLPLWARVSIGYAAAFAFAALMERNVERPLLAWRKRYEGSWQPVGALRPKGLE